MNREIKPRDKFILHSENGKNYKVTVINVNYFREPSMVYALNIVAPDGADFYETYGDWFFCGESFFKNCEYVPKELA